MSKIQAKRQKYTDEELFIAARAFKTRTEFARKDSGAYSAAQERKLLDEVCAFMGVKSNKKRTDEELIEIISKYKTEKELIKNNEPVYRAAKKRGIYDSISGHLEKTLESWTPEKIKERALLCKDREEFYTKEKRAYGAAAKRGILKEVMAHMPPSEKEAWLDEELLELASEYKSIQKFRNENGGAYCAIIKRKISEKAFAHMGKHGNNSIPEQILIDDLKKKFPKLTKLRDRKVKVDGKPHIQGFDIDIYIPELRKGIEFDGFYWHSVEGLQRSRKNWPLEDLENYHKLKDNHFLSKGIKILHIKEMDWYENPNKCLEEIEKFLKG